ncbi:LLM class flavin-dependent oxidoreductase [Nocardia pseudovaccinii]|uniref:LLM class flavin-dependent oxidoreductase n=1 Tax=Nocardia pseudovaccinii TaxID=189540 RepID=UPI003D8FABA1
MRFDSGLLAHVGDLSRYPQVDEWLELPKLLESAGYTGVWCAEHHFSWDTGVTPTPTNPLMYASYIATNTTNLRIGLCGLNLPAWHPLRAAEDAAFVDHISGGRLDFGFMKGMSPKISTNFDAVGRGRDHGRTNADVMWEAYDVIRKFWSGEPFSHDGTYFTFPAKWEAKGVPKEAMDPTFYGPHGELIAIKGIPLPFQDPIPPAWVMVDSVSSHEQAARNGVGTLCFANTFEGTREIWNAYRKAANEADAGGALPAGANSRFGMMRPTFVASTQEEAEAVMRPALNKLFGGFYGVDSWLGRQNLIASHQELTEEDRDCDWFDFFQRHEQIFVGTPEFVTERLKKYEEELGAEHLVMYWSMPDVSYGQMTDSIKLFADKVMPNFPSGDSSSVLESEKVGA